MAMFSETGMNSVIKFSPICRQNKHFIELKEFFSFELTPNPFVVFVVVVVFVFVVVFVVVFVLFSYGDRIPRSYVARSFAIVSMITFQVVFNTLVSSISVGITSATVNVHYTLYGAEVRYVVKFI